jgi:hypothetical protein
VSKASIGILGKDAKGRQRTENSLEGWRVCLRRFCEVINRLRLRPEEIGNAESRHDVDGLDDEWARPDQIQDSGHRFAPIAALTAHPSA